MSREECLIREDTAAKSRQLDWCAHDDHRFKRRQIRQNRDDLADQGRVHYDHPVLGMIGYEVDLVSTEADVQRMQHRSHGRHGQIGFHVRLMVPAICRDPIIAAYTQCSQRLRQTRCSLGDLEVGGTFELRAIKAKNFTLAVDSQAVPEDHLRSDRNVHYGRLHHPIKAEASASSAGTSRSRPRA